MTGDRSPRQIVRQERRETAIAPRITTYYANVDTSLRKPEGSLDIDETAIAYCEIPKGIAVSRKTPLEDLLEALDEWIEYIKFFEDRMNEEEKQIVEEYREGKE